MRKQRLSRWKHFTSCWRNRALLLLLLVIGVLVAGLPQTPTGGHGGIELGARGEGEPGHYCNTIIPVLQHFQFTTQDIGNGRVQVDFPDNGLFLIFKPAGSLETLPAPDPSKDLTYDPQTKQVCASEKNGTPALEQFVATASAQAVSPGDNGNQASSISLDPATWVTNALTGFWDTLWKQMAGFFQQVIDWANDFGFIWITPSALSYQNPMVHSGAAWALGALDGYIALLLVVGGYQILLNRGLGLEERSGVLTVAMRVIFMAIIANTGFFLLLPSMVELSNNLGMGIMGTLMNAAQGDVSLPLGAINWAEQPISWSLFILIYFLISLLLIAVEAVRLAVLDVTIMFSPLWIMALANEYSRAWGKFGALTFFSALFMQPIQVGCISLGAALIANFGHFNPGDPALCQQMNGAAHTACVAHLGNGSFSSSMNPVVLVLGIATLYVAIKIPGMLFSNALRASVGSVNRDIAQVARTAMSFVFIQNELKK